MSKRRRLLAANRRKNERALAGGVFILLVSFYLLSGSFPLVRQLAYAAHRGTMKTSTPSE